VTRLAPLIVVAVSLTLAVTNWGNTGITDPALFVLGLSAVYLIAFRKA